MQAARFGTVVHTVQALKKKGDLPHGLGEEQRHLNPANFRNDSWEGMPESSVCAEIGEARKQSLNSWDFMQRSMQILHRSRLTTAIFVLFSLLCISMILMGIKYLKQCPLQPKIPIYLLVGGSFGMVKTASILWAQSRYRSYELIDDTNDDTEETSWLQTFSSEIAHTVLTCFLAGWFCAGNYWVFQIWPPHYRPLMHQPQRFCDKGLYIFSVTQIITCQVSILAFVVMVLAILCFYRCK